MKRAGCGKGVGKERRFFRDVKVFLGRRVPFHRRERADQEPLAQWKKGSLTVETACILPLFLWTALFALYLTAAVSMEVHLAMGLHDTGRNLAVLKYARDHGEDAGMVEGSLSAAYAKSSVLKKAAIRGNPLYASTNFSMMGSDFRSAEIIDIRLTAKIKMPIPLFHLKTWKLSERARMRAWTGSVYGEGAGTDGEGDEQGEMVYVTATGTVYHRDRNCTHIKLSIQEVGKDSVEKLRNRGGAKYYPCSCYKSHPSSSVYITRDGTRYHSSVSCSSLKRTVKKVALSDAGQLKPCSKCG